MQLCSQKHPSFQRNGFFIECGALDGDETSNTLYIERHLGWTGLLVEADQIAVPDLIATNRQSWMVPNCLSISPQVSEVTFGTKYNYGRILHTEKGKSDYSLFSCNHHTVICYPLYSLLAAINQTKVDYFSLDVEGFELDILKTIPFEQVEITVRSMMLLNESCMTQVCHMLLGPFCGVYLYWKRCSQWKFE